jgi:hypothetical protein
MIKLKSKLRLASIAASALAVSSTGAFAATDDAYSTNDLLMFFQNPSGTAGTDQVVTFSLGSTYNVFRNAATPSSANFGSTISLGNINTILSSTFGADWTGTSSSIFAGAAGQNGATSSLSSATSNQDYARTVYVTKPRTGQGTLGLANSSSVTLPGGTSAQQALASNISGSNNSAPVAQPGSEALNDTIIDDNNPFFNGNPSTAYGQLNGGVMGALSSTTYSFGSISNVVLGLDLYRATPVLNASGWQNIESIPGVTAGSGYYLGTITLSSNGDLNFAAVPEPSTYALIALTGLLYFFVNRRRKTSNQNI